MGEAHEDNMASSLCSESLPCRRLNTLANLIDRIIPGDIIVFKRRGKLAAILSWLLQRFEPHYDRWGWHMSMVAEVRQLSRYEPNTFPHIVEAHQEGVRIAPLPLDQEFRVYRWFPDTVTMGELLNTIYRYLGCPYDSDAYVGTIVSYFWYRIRGKQWRIVDNEFHCWELVFQICGDLGYPIQPFSRYPIISDFLKHYRKGKSLNGIYLRDEEDR